MLKEENHHIIHLKKHRNFLYGLVVILLILQVISFISINGQMALIQGQQNQIQESIEENYVELSDSIDLVRTESQYKTTEILKEVAQQKEDVQNEINLIKAGQEDFSGVIEQALKSVVNVATDKSAGTGFFVNSEGYILTNEHVISGASYVKISTYDGKQYTAQVINTDPVSDVAVIKVPGVFQSIDLEDSENLQVGEKVIAIGNPLGLSFTVTEGIISALNRNGPNGDGDYVQTDVTLNPGNSGGPLITKEGKVAGINNFKIGNAESLGFALESNVFGEIANTLANKTITNFG